MTLIGDAVTFVHFIEGVEKEVPAIVTGIREDAHGQVVADLHALVANVTDVVEEAKATVDDTGKLIGSCFRTVAKSVGAGSSASASAPAPSAGAQGNQGSQGSQGSGVEAALQADNDALQAQVSVLEAELAAAQAGNQGSQGSQGSQAAIPGTIPAGSQGAQGT